MRAATKWRRNGLGILAVMWTVSLGETAGPPPAAAGPQAPPSPAPLVQEPKEAVFDSLILTISARLTWVGLLLFTLMFMPSFVHPKYIVFDSSKARVSH